MLVLFETSSGYALFKVNDTGKVKDQDLSELFKSPESAQKIVTLKNFQKFENTTEALSAATALVESKLNKGLKSFLKSSLKGKDLKEQLATQDPKLSSLIKEKIGIQCVSGTEVNEVFRGIRTQLESLLSGIQPEELTAMSLGLSHSLSRYKLKFSPDKVDTMIVQAIALLDMLDKELNVFSMRVREWYGWHFPELSKIIPDHLMYCKTIKNMGVKSKAQKTDFSDVLPTELEKEVKEAAQISMGTDISTEDEENIFDLCNQVIDITEYREELYEYLKNRMQAIAPNLTALLGELVGARLIAHAGSLLSLAKHPASTVQILGAEKALFRALKTKHETPKYGLIYHASLIGQTTPQNKGKISRLLAAKASLSCRVDALGEKEEQILIGNELRDKVVDRIRQVDGTKVRQISKLSKVPQQKQYDPKKADDSTLRKVTQYNPSSDLVLEKAPQTEEPPKKEKKSKKEKEKGKEVKEKKKSEKKEKKKEKSVKKETPEKVQTKGKRKLEEKSKEEAKEAITQKKKKKKTEK